MPKRPTSPSKPTYTVEELFFLFQPIADKSGLPQTVWFDQDGYANSSAMMVRAGATGAALSILPSYYWGSIPVTQALAYF